MTVTVNHPFVSTVPDSTDTSLVRPSNWNANHTVVGLGTAAELNAGVANGVATLDSGGQVPLSQIPPLGDLNYQGTWNASTNSPTLTSSTGTKGYYYVVSVAGSTNLNGITDWKVSDWAVFNGSVWQKIDNTDAVTSVNGYTGAVVLTAADVSAVPYTGATTAVDLNAQTLTNIAHLGINSTAVPDILLRAYGDNNSSSRIGIRGYSSDANSSSMRVAKFRGTFAAPQAPQSGDSLGKFELAGYGTTSSSGYPQASIEGLATENWGATARGAKAVIKVTPNTTTTQVTAVTINQDSTAVFANTVTANGVLLTGNTGTVTGVTGTAPVVSSGGTTPAISMAAATASVNGYLTSADWTTFNSKGTGTVTSVSATAPVTSTGGTTPTIAMPAATTAVSGYLTNTDWTTFNNKGSGSVTSVAATVPAFLSVAGSPITSSGTLAISYSGTALPVANGGTGLTAVGTSGNVLTSNGSAWVSSAPVSSNITAQGLFENAKTISANYTIGTGNNAVSAGPITINSGIVVTVPSGSTWVVV